jgi:hypothetical protein
MALWLAVYVAALNQLIRHWLISEANQSGLLRNEMLEMARVYMRRWC